MFRRKGLLIILLLLACVTTITLGNQMSSASTEEVPKRILLIYDFRNYFADLRDSITTTRELLGHFNVVVDEIDQAEYQSGQIDQYDYIFVIGLQGIFRNQDMIKDLAISEKTICWVGKGIELLLDETDRYHIRYEGPIYDFATVTYWGDQDSRRDKSVYPIGVKREFSAVSIYSDEVEVLSWLDTGLFKSPFVLNDDNLWYVSRIDLNEPLFYIFADVLMEILPGKVEGYQKVYIRIEDVHPFRDTKKLRAIADYLGDKGIPFMVGLIPAHRLPGEKYVTEFDELPDFVEAIQYMQERGGTIILNGYTHTIYESDIKGEGFEYWDGDKDQPLEVNIDDWVRYTIGRGIMLTVENEIYPLGFEAPHYAMSQGAYASLKKYFSTYSGQIQSSDWGFSSSTVPYELRDTKLFNKLLPENLGYVDPFDPDSIQKIKHNYEMIQIVRHHMAGVFFHSYLDIEYLEEVVEFFESQNVEYYDMRQDFHWVKFGEYELISDQGEITVQYPEERGDARKRLRLFFNRTAFLLVGVLGLVVYAFARILLKSRKQTDRKMKE